MKKQINPTIKAHLIRGAFYLLLLLAVCAIPFALAQSETRTKQSAKPEHGHQARCGCEYVPFPHVGQSAGRAPVTLCGLQLCRGS